MNIITHHIRPTAGQAPRAEILSTDKQRPVSPVEYLFSLILFIMLLAGVGKAKAEVTYLIRPSDHKQYQFMQSVSGTRYKGSVEADNTPSVTLEVLDKRYVTNEQKNDGKAKSGLFRFTYTQSKSSNGYGIQFKIKVSAGWRIRKITFVDTEGYSTYRNNEEFLQRLKCAPNAGSYTASRNPDEEGDTFKDNNNYVFTQYDAPASELTFTIPYKEEKDGDPFKCRDILVHVVKARDYSFTQTNYNINVKQTIAKTLKYGDGNTTAVPTYQVVQNDGIVSIEGHDGKLVAKRGGTTKIKASWAATDDYSKVESEATFNVARLQNPANISKNEYQIQSWDSIAIPAINNLPTDMTFSNGTTVSKAITYASSNKLFVIRNGYIVATSAKEAANQSTAITMTIPADLYTYAEKKLTFTVKAGANSIDIKTKDDWMTFQKLVVGGNTSVSAFLKNDLTLDEAADKVDYSIGYSGKLSSTNDLILQSYQGHFDGGFHTLTINFVEDRDQKSLFTKCMDGAVISNLRLEGTLTSKQRILGSIINTAGTLDSDPVTIENCISNVTINSQWADYGQGYVGGLVGSSVNVCINDCAYTGTISGSPTTMKSGLIGWADTSTKAQVNNCLLPVNNMDYSSNPIVWTAYSVVTCKNTYYSSKFQNGPGGTTKVTDEQLKSGEVAWLLQSRRETTVWGQKLDSDNYPYPTGTTDLQVLRVKIGNDGTNSYSSDRYINMNSTVKLPTAEEIAGNKYDATHYYTLSFGNFKADTKITEDTNITVSFSQNDYLPIKTTADWTTFCNYIKNQSTKVTAKLESDIYDVKEMAGDSNHKYAGTFDGQNHTLNVNLTGTGQGTAPFFAVENATIRNLCTAGTIKQTGKGKKVSDYAQSHASGLVGMAWGVTIENCQVSSEIRFTEDVAKDVHSGGFIGHAESKNVVMRNCLFNGTFVLPDKDYGGIAGLVGWGVGSGTFEHCLINCRVKRGLGLHPAIYKANGDKPTISSTGIYYYANGIAVSNDARYDIGNPTSVTAEQLGNGYTLDKLGDAWGQAIGIDGGQAIGIAAPSLVSFSDKSQKNYVFKRNGIWHADNFLMYDELTFSLGINFNAGTMTYRRSMEKDKPYTIVLPFNWTKNDNSKVYVLNGVTGSQTKSISFTPAPGYLYSANKPYLIVPNTNISEFTATNVTVKANPEDNTSMQDTKDYASMVPTYKLMSNSEAQGVWIMQNDKMWHRVTSANTAATIPAYRAYLVLNNGASAKEIYSISFEGDDNTTTGIGNIRTEDADGTVRYYDLSGRYVGTSLDKLPKGLYIRNGKKIVK